MTRLTRQQAAVRLGVSESTVDRMIRRGQLATEREYHGGRYTVWVLVDDETAYSSADETAQAELSSEGNSAYAKQPDADNSAYSDEQTAYPSGDELAVLRTENQALRELSDWFRLLVASGMRKHPTIGREIRYKQTEPEGCMWSTRCKG